MYYEWLLLQLCLFLKMHLEKNCLSTSYKYKTIISKMISLPTLQFKTKEGPPVPWQTMTAKPAGCLQKKTVSEFAENNVWLLKDRCVVFLVNKLENLFEAIMLLVLRLHSFSQLSWTTKMTIWRVEPTTDLTLYTSNTRASGTYKKLDGVGPVDNRPSTD